MDNVYQQLCEYNVCTWHQSLYTKYKYKFDEAIAEFIVERGELTYENRWALHYKIFNKLIKKNEIMYSINNVNDIDEIKNRIIIYGYHYNPNNDSYSSGNPCSLYENLNHGFDKNLIDKYRYTNLFDNINNTNQNLKKSINNQYTFHSISSDELNSIASDIQNMLINEEMDVYL